MTQSDNTDTRDAGEGRKTTLTLKRTVDQGQVRQSFGKGQSNNVVVQTKRKRTISAPATTARKPSGAGTPPPSPSGPPTVESKKPRRQGGKGGGRSEGGGDGLTRKLSDAEKDARLRALQAARLREAEEKKRAEAEAKQRAEDEARKVREEAEARRKAEEEAARKAEEEARERMEAEARAAEEQARAAAAAKSAAKAERRAEPTEEDVSPPSEKPTSITRRAAPPAPVAPEDAPAPLKPFERSKRMLKPEVPKTPTPAKRGEGDRRQRGKLTITNALDEEQRERSLASLRRRQERQKKQMMGGGAQSRDKIVREVTIPEVITIQELANRMAERAVDVIKFLMKQGEMHKINDVIDVDTAELLVEEFGHTPKRVAAADVEEGFIGADDAEEDQEPRAPVVTIMGHVDHGKTSLLDALRKANVVAGEAGGITQHIGAYQVDTPSGGRVTFIDTPGHAAFTSMRARGAKATDIVILVVAADDGVMPQTIEAINHAKAAEVPIIVAINKMDKPSADPDRVRTELLQYEVIVESMSGETLEVEVSALKGDGLDTLLDAITMQAELLELKANPNRNAEGVVIEAKLERGRGPVGTVLVQRGMLRVGHIVVAGSAWGKVRALINDQGDHVKEAGPSVPVEILGFNSTPEAGDAIAVVDTEARAREITEYRDRLRREKLAGGTGARTLEQMMNKLKEDGKKEFPVVIKSDVQGSAEAIVGALDKLGTDEVGANVLHNAVGGITESDITLASASDAVILGFNTRANAQAKQAAEREGVEIRYYSVIYDLVDDVKAAMSGMLDPEIRETFIGYAEILQVFHISKVGKVAGCRVTEGRVERGSGVRLLRDNVVIHEGKLSTLKRFKDEVKEVQVGQECGMAFEKYEDLREGDQIECFTTEKIERTLD